MYQKILSAYEFYKGLHPDLIILFQIENHYEAYLEDAGCIHRLMPTVTLRTKSALTFVIIPKDKKYDIECVLGEANRGCHIVSYLNDSGTFDIPDVETILYEEEIDY